LDPFDEFKQEHLRNVLRRVGLAPNGGRFDRNGNASTSNIGDAAVLDDNDVDEVLSREVLSGDGLSAGEQQLLSFARALLRIEHGQVKIVIMDEPTANIDMATDDGVQRLVRSALKGLTVITIAHRLNTIIDFDKILVMDKGQVAEHGAPLDLLADTGMCACITHTCI
jgi:ABC-type multidrug transport system fused ATPase/permease subunit